MNKIFATFLISSLLVIPAKAEVLPANAASNAPLAPIDGGPIEVTAEESLEWYQDQQLYVARGKAKAVRGTMVIEADLLTAHQRDKAASDGAGNKADPSQFSGDIDRLTAEGNVRITDPRQQIFGEKAIYDLERRIAVLTGQNLKYQTAKETVTARDSLEYHEAEGLAVARGDAVAVQNKRRVEADVLTASFAANASGEQDLRQIIAEGGVTIITGSDIAKGDRAVYDLAKDIAVLSGNVQINRGGTQLTGDKAEVEFKTGQSRLLNDGKGRVRALLSPSGGKN